MGRLYFNFVLRTLIHRSARAHSHESLGQQGINRSSTNHVVVVLLVRSFSLSVVERLNFYMDEGSGNFRSRHKPATRLRLVGREFFFLLLPCHFSLSCDGASTRRAF